MPAPHPAGEDDPRRRALACRAAGDHAGALAAFEAAGPDPWNRNDAALERLALGRLAEAEAAAAALAREAADFAPARRTLALIARRRGDHEAALGHFREAAARAPHDLWNRQDEASELRALGRMAEAEAAYRTLAAGTPLPHAIRGLGLAARERGDGEGALGHFRVAAELAPGDPWFALDVARARIALGRLDEAEAGLAALAAAHPRFAAGWREQARLARRRGDAADELGHWRAASASDPRDDDAALDLADALLAHGEVEEAETIAARCLVRTPALARACGTLAAAARRRGDGERALAHSRAAAGIAPADAPRQRDLAADLLAVGRPEEAERAAVVAIALDPALDEAHRLRRLARRALGDRAGALALARERWSGGAGPSRAGFDLAQDLREAGAWDEAGALLALLADRDDAALEARLELGIGARRREGVAAAARWFGEALALDPGHPRTHLLLGDIRREAGERAAAAAHYEAALGARPGFTWALVGQALLARDAGDPVGAERHWRAAIEADPAEGHAQIELAAALRERGELEAARALLAAIPPHSPRAAAAAMAGALILRAAGDFAGAAAAFAAAARRWPGLVEALVEQAEDEARAGRFAAADAALEAAATAAPEHPALLEALARRALARDDLGEALGLLARAGASDPGRLWPILGQARIHAMLGRTDEALAGFAAAETRFGPRPEIAMAWADIERQLGEPLAAEQRLTAARARCPGHPMLGYQGATAAIEAGRLAVADAWLAEAPQGVAPGRLRFVASLLAVARWDFAAALSAGEAAAATLPADGWIRNRLIHSALLAFDLPRAGRELADLARLEAAANRLRGKSANPSQSHYGQLYDEFRLDPAAAAALRAALDLPAGERLDALAGAVRQFPASTAAAILHLVEARRSGALDRVAGSGERRSAIPRVIHQYWNDESVPPDVARYMASWRDAHPGFEHRVWSDVAALGFLREHGPAETLDAYRRAREPAMKADLFRLALLAREGGIWVDADDRCLAGVEALVTGGAGLVAYQEDLGSLGNNWLAAAPGHPVIASALREASAAVNRGDGDILWLSTGPGLLTRTAAAALCEGTGDLLVLDRPVFLAHVAIHCLAAYKSSERHWSRTAFGRARPAAGTAAQATRTRSS